MFGRDKMDYSAVDSKTVNVKSLRITSEKEMSFVDASEAYPAF